MAITVRVDPVGRLIRSDIVGDFSLNDIISAVTGALEHPEFRRGFNVLTDHTRVGEPLTSYQARQLVELLDWQKEKLAGSRWAAVVRSPASHGMMRMVSALAESIPMDVRVFETLRAAEAWLGESRRT